MPSSLGTNSSTLAMPKPRRTRAHNDAQANPRAGEKSLLHPQANKQSPKRNPGSIPATKPLSIPQSELWKLRIPAPTGAHGASATSKLQRRNLSRLPLSFGKQRDAGTARKCP